MAYRAPRQLLAVASCAAIMVAACTSDRSPAGAGAVILGETQSQQDTHDHGRTVKVSQDLSAAQFFGTSLPAKTLALTFDDGPGPRTAELSIYLKSQNIKAAFFMNGARLAATALPNPNNLTPVANPAGILAQVLADGHLVANHTTTHRNLTTGVPDGERVQELSDTDTDITGYVSPQNHLLFRAPFGAYNNTVFNTLSASAMNKYIGPIYWEQGGFSDQYPTAAADWACWQGSLYTGAAKVTVVPGSPGYATTAQCGDAYLAEINATGKGIVLMHDPYSWAQGSTVDMVKYLVPKLILAGYSFVRVDEVPAIAAALPPPPCHATCATCSGPSANECTACLGGRYKSGGQCLACSTCNAGQYAATACSPSANTICAACSVCGAGKYPSAACTPTANTVCSACNASCTTCSGPNADQCGTCPASFFVSGGKCAACAVCAAGTFQATACATSTDATCTACEPGTTSTAGATSCASCPAGSFAAGPGAAACTACGNCDDSDACTQDRCDAAKGCVHDAIVGCGGSSGAVLGADASADPVAAESDSGCTVSGRPGGSSGHERGLFALAALGMSLLARRRRPHTA